MQDELSPREKHRLESELLQVSPAMDGGLVRLHFPSYILTYTSACSRS